MSSVQDKPEVPVARQGGRGGQHAGKSAGEGVSSEPSHLASAAT